MQYNGYKIAAGLHGNVPGISSGVILLVHNGVLAIMHVTRCRPLFLWHQSHDTAIMSNLTNILSNKGKGTGLLTTLNISWPKEGLVHCPTDDYKYGADRFKSKL